MTNKDMRDIKREMLKLMILSNKLERDAIFEAMKHTSGVTELNSRFFVLQIVNRKLNDELNKLGDTE